MFGLQNVCLRVLSIRWFSTHSCVTSMPPNLVCSSRCWVCLNLAEIFKRRSVRASIICPSACAIRNEEPFLSQLRMNESIYGPMWLPSCLLFCDLRYEFFSVLIDCQFYLFSVHCKDRGSSSLNSGFKRTCLVSSYVPTMWHLLLCNFHTSFLPRSSTQRACFERWIVRISSILSSRLVDSTWRSCLCTTAEEFSTYGSIWTRSRFLSFVIRSFIRMHVDISLTELATCWCLAILTFGCMPIFTLGSFLAISFPDMNVRWIVLFAGSACICGRCRMFSFFFRLATFFSESEFVKKNGFFYAVMLFFQVARETARISFVTLALCGALHTVSDDFWMLLLFLCLCLSLSLFAGAPERGFSSMPFLALKWNYLIFCSTSLWTTSLRLSWLYDLPLIRVIWLQTCIKYFNAPGFSSCILYRLSKKLSASLSDTKDRTSAHSVSMDCMSFFSCNCMSSPKSRMDGDHPSNVKHVQEVLAVCAFPSSIWTCLLKSPYIFFDPNCKSWSRVKDSEVWKIFSRYRFGRHKISETFFCFDSSWPLHSWFRRAGAMRCFAFGACSQDLEARWIRPFFEPNHFCFFLFWMSAKAVVDGKNSWPYSNCSQVLWLRLMIVNTRCGDFEELVTLLFFWSFWMPPHVYRKKQVIFAVKR